MPQLYLHVRYFKSLWNCGRHWLQVLYAARRGFYFVLPKPGASLQRGGGDSATAGQLHQLHASMSQ